MATFRRADERVKSLARSVMNRYHQSLAEAGVTCTVLFAHAPRNAEGEPTGPALKAAGGYPAAGKAKIVSQKDRVAGETDTIIYLDGDRWEEFTEGQQEALLDHEENHFELRLDEDGNVLLDDCNRPKLKYRVHDIEVGAFLAIAERHGEDALEVMQIRHLVSDNGQLLMPWGAEFAAVTA